MDQSRVVVVLSVLMASATSLCLLSCLTAGVRHGILTNRDGLGWAGIWIEVNLKKTTFHEMKRGISAGVLVALCGVLSCCGGRSSERVGNVKVTLYEIDKAMEKSGHWEHTIRSQMTLPNPEADAIAKALKVPGQAPPAVLDVLHLECGAQVGTEAFVVTSLFQRGIEVRPASITDGRLRVAGESRVLGNLPEVAKILESSLFRMMNDRMRRKKGDEDSSSEE